MQNRLRSALSQQKIVTQVQVGAWREIGKKNSRDVDQPTTHMPQVVELGCLRIIECGGGPLYLGNIS